MIDPELDDDVREALLAERARPAVLDHEGKRRVLARLAVSMAGVVSASALASTVAKDTATRAGTSLARASLVKLFAVAAVGFAAGAGTHAAYMQSAVTAAADATTSVPAVASALVLATPVSATSTPSSVVPVVDVASLPAMTRADASAPRAGAAVDSATPLGRVALRLRERSLLESAQAALAHENPTEALATVTRHAVEFPKSDLAEERDALRIRALAKLGQCEEARAATGRFVIVFPGSLQRSALERLCAP